MATRGEFNFILIYKANKLHVKVNSLLSSSSRELAYSSYPYTLFSSYYSSPFCVIFSIPCWLQTRDYFLQRSLFSIQNTHTSEAEVSNFRIQNCLSRVRYSPSCLNYAFSWPYDYYLVFLFFYTEDLCSKVHLSSCPEIRGFEWKGHC